MKKLLIALAALTAITSTLSAGYVYVCDQDGNCEWIYIYD